MRKIHWILLLIIVLLLLIYFIKSKNDNIFTDYIYLDNNSTTPMSSETLNAYKKGAGYGNASSSYAHQAKEIIQKNDDLIKNYLNIKDYLPIYTSGASESNNTILKAVCHHNINEKSPKHFILSSYEHKTSLDCAEQLEKDGLITLTLIKPDMKGFIHAEDVIKHIQDNTALISIMHVNNELGSINDIDLISKKIKERNPNIIFHSDIVQSFGKIPVNTSNLDAFSISYHKIYGPIGLGLLVIHNKLFPIFKEHPLIAGSQNYELRGGTINTPAICAAYNALTETIKNRKHKNNVLLQKKMYIVNFLKKHFPIVDYQDYYQKPESYQKPKQNYPFEIIFLGDAPESPKMAPGTLLLNVVKFGNFKFCNIQLKKYLERNGVIISIGSACNSDSSKASHVLFSLDCPHICRCGVVRISIGDENTWYEIYKFCNILLNGILEQRG